MWVMTVSHNNCQPFHSSPIPTHSYTIIHTSHTHTHIITPPVAPAPGQYRIESNSAALADKRRPLVY